MTDETTVGTSQSTKTKQLRLVFGTKVLPHPDKVRCNLAIQKVLDGHQLMGNGLHCGIDMLPFHCRLHMEGRMLSLSAKLAVEQWALLMELVGGRKAASIPQVDDRSAAWISSS